jgi:hypothetical protein
MMGSIVSSSVPIFWQIAHALTNSD